MIDNDPTPFHGLHGPAAPGSRARSPRSRLRVMQASPPAGRAADHHLRATPPAGRSTSIFAAPSAKSSAAPAATRPAAGCRRPKRRRQRAARARPAQARRGRARGDAVAAALGVARRAARRRIGRAAQAGGRSAPRQRRRGSRPRRRGMPPIVSCRPWPAISRSFEEASRALFADDRRRFVGLDRRLARRYPRPRRQARLQRPRLGAISQLPSTAEPVTRHCSSAAMICSALIETSRVRLPPLWKTFLRFVAPMMLSNILQSLFGTINNVYLGQMSGSTRSRPVRCSSLRCSSSSPSSWA